MACVNVHVRTSVYPYIWYISWRSNHVRFFPLENMCECVARNEPNLRVILRYLFFLDVRHTTYTVYFVHWYSTRFCRKLLARFPGAKNLLVLGTRSISGSEKRLKFMHRKSCPSFSEENTGKELSFLTLPPSESNGKLHAKFRSWSRRRPFPSLSQFHRVASPKLDAEYFIKGLFCFFSRESRRCDTAWIHTLCIEGEIKKGGGLEWCKNVKFFPVSWL